MIVKGINSSRVGKQMTPSRLRSTKVAMTDNEWLARKLDVLNK